MSEYGRRRRASPLPLPLTPARRRCRLWLLIQARRREDRPLHLARGHPHLPSFPPRGFAQLDEVRFVVSELTVHLPQGDEDEVVAHERHGIVSAREHRGRRGRSDPLELHRRLERPWDVLRPGRGSEPGDGVARGVLDRRLGVRLGEVEQVRPDLAARHLPVDHVHELLRGHARRRTRADVDGQPMEKPFIESRQLLVVQRVASLRVGVERGAPVIGRVARPERARAQRLGRIRLRPHGVASSRLTV
mmetsp:Transcript_12373/g.56325  ORF Transcript_12373/g.56325 Transcript_12373/m.56325 type:complete len:247 (-) Transcript_12373:495-1235(-)